MRQTTPQPRARVPLGLMAGAVIVALLLAAAVLAWVAWQWQTLASSYPWVADTIRLSLALGGALFLLWLAAIVVMGLYNRWASRAAAFADKEIDMMRATKQVAPLATSFTYHDAHQISAPALAAPEPPSATLPGAIDLAALDCRPTIDHILLGVDELGQITVSVPDLCHVALLGSTGGGKSNLLRLILPQLQKIGAQVILADPHFAPLDPDSGDDWRPIADRLIHAPAVTAAAIDQELSFMLDELARRLEKRNAGQPVGPPLFFAFDELPVIADLVKDAPARLGKLLREGRKVQLLTIGASQSMLIKEVGGSSTLRDAYRTCFYAGGDKKSAAAMLDMPERTIDDGPLGAGVVLLRSKATAPARLVRVPLVSNASLYSLLGVVSAPQIAPTEPLSNQLQNGFGFAAMAQPRQRNDNALTAPADSGSNPTGSGNPPSAESARVIALFKAGKSIGDIIRELHGPIAGAQYQKARAKVEQIIQAALQGVN